MSCFDAYPCKVHQYGLKGPQVEPDASYWNHCPQLRLVTIDELLKITDDKNHPGYFPPYPDPCTPEGEQQIKEEMHELLKLQELRDDPCALANPGPLCPALTEKPCYPVEKLPNAIWCRAPVSRLFNLMPPALGAVQVNRLPGQQVIRTGRGLARAVENETPGIFHRHALNYLITTRSWSPPRQALIWATLDVAIASALQAAWYYKWLSPLPLTSRRERPIEYAVRHGYDLRVLYDHPDELNPRYITCPDARPCAPNPGFSPGTPRHPAYPSGHSTYAGAASTVLAYFFGNDWTPNVLTLCNASSTIGQELRDMADNIGMGRMWAGIHWRSDHEAGLKLGQVVACLVLRQLASICGGKFELCPPTVPGVSNCDCGQVANCPDDPPTPCDKLQTRAKECRHHCPPCWESGEYLPDPCPAAPDPQPGAALAAEELDQRSVQSGAVSAQAPEAGREQPAAAASTEGADAPAEAEGGDTQSDRNAGEQ